MPKIIKILKNISKKFILLMIIFLLIPVVTNAHPGDDLEDAHGCHYCWTNCSNWNLSYGQFHCHSKSSSSCYLPKNVGCATNTDLTNIQNNCAQKSAMNTVRGGAGSDFASAEQTACQTMIDECKQQIIDNKIRFDNYNKCLTDEDDKKWATTPNQKPADVSSVCAKSWGQNSYFNEQKSSCACNYGYIIDIHTPYHCIPINEFCLNTFGKNFQPTITKEACECKNGFVKSKSGDLCISVLEKCQENFGVGAMVYNDINCTCGSKYEFNMETKKCVEKKVAITAEQIYAVPSTTQKLPKTNIVKNKIPNTLQPLQNVRQNIVKPTNTAFTTSTQQDAQPVLTINAVKQEGEKRTPVLEKAKKIINYIFEKIKFW